METFLFVFNSEPLEQVTQQHSSNNLMIVGLLLEFNGMQETAKRSK